MIAITGATGRIGLRLVEKLRRQKMPLVAIVRSAESARKLPSGVKFRIASLENGEGVKEALEGADFIVNLAGSTDTRLGEGKLSLANISSTSHLFHSLPDGIKHAVHISSIAIYGKKLPRLPCPETAHPNPDNAYARTKWAGEHIAREASIRVSVTVLRPGIVYGPSFEEGFFPMLKKIKEGSAKIIGDGENRIPLVHVDDVVDAIVLSLKGKKPGLSVYNICGEEATQKQVLGMAAQGLGVEPPSKTIGYGAARAFASANEFFSSLQGRRTSFTPEMVDQMACDRYFDTAMAKRELGWSPCIGLKEGIKQTIKQYNSVKNPEWKNGKNA
jgi:2-alkyl-3-oxoalkanoate reductase